MTQLNNMTMRCTCGNVECAVIGAPIMSAACYCDDCQEGARQIEALPGASPVLDGAGGTEYLLYRKDRMTLLKGGDLVHHFKIKEESPTIRAVATCCNSAMFLDFQKGHWYSIYRTRAGDGAPPLQMRIQTRFKPGNGDIPSDGVPCYERYPLKFIARLIAAKVGMLVGR